MNFLKELETKFLESQANTDTDADTKLVEGETPTESVPQQTFFDYAREQLRKLGLNLYSDDTRNTWLVKYRGDKKGLNFDEATVRYGRSLVADGTTHETLLVAPPKSWTYESFRQEHPDMADVQVEDFPSGPMVNVAFHGDKWIKATRSYVGAQNKFRSEKTFEVLFDEAFKQATGLEFDGLTDQLDQNLTYSWVLQHPEFLDVARPSEPTLNLVEVRDSKAGHQLVDLTSVEASFKEKNWKVKFPKHYNFKTWDEVDTFVGSQDCQAQGLVFRHQDQRSKVRNPSFICARNLLGNHSKTLEMFTENHQNKTIEDFLAYFPEFKSDFANLEDCVESLASEIHTNYRATNTRPKGDRIDFRREIPKSLQTACFNIHQEYWSSGNDIKSRQPVYLSTVCDYINQMPHMDLANMICSRREEQKNDSGRVDDIKKMRQATQQHRQRNHKMNRRNPYQNFAQPDTDDTPTNTPSAAPFDPATSPNSYANKARKAEEVAKEAVRKALEKAEETTESEESTVVEQSSEQPNEQED